jgi:hypothetical protein
MNTTGRLAIVLSLCCSAPGAAEMRRGSPRIPFAFIENQGQSVPEVRYTGTNNETRVLFTEWGAEFQRGGAKLNMKFVGGAMNPAIEASGPTGAVANYFRGNDSSQWRARLKMYNAIRYSNVWLGVDVRFASDGIHPKSEYILAPGAEVDQIRLRFDGAVSIHSDGGMTASAGTSAGHTVELSEERPVIYQEGAAGRIEVQGKYRLNADGTVGFSVEQYDHTRTLVVDPVIVLSGYFGNGAQSVITAVAINSINNILVAGWTVDNSLSTPGVRQTNYAGGVDAFVAGFSPSGGQLLFCTYLGGTGQDEALGIAVDSSNNTYITGWTSSSNFPVVNAAQTRLSGARDAFITKLNPAGTAIVFSTYLGGTGADEGNAISLDSGNCPVIVGDTTSSNLPALTGTAGPKYAGNQDAFVAKLSADGRSVAFSTYLGGSGTDHGAALAVDSANAIYVGGGTYSANFPLQHAAQAHSGGGQDGFVAKLSATGVTLAFSTYYGGSGGAPGLPEQVNAIVVIQGSVVVAGTTSSTNFPVTKVCNQAAFGGGSTDGFVGRFDATTGALTRSTYFGGSGDDGINALAVDFYGFDLIGGYTTSQDLPVQNAIQSSPGGGMDGFVAKLSAYTLSWGTYLGGNGNDAVNALAIDSMTSVVAGGQTSSSNIPVRGAMAAWPGGASSSFLVKIAPAFTPAIASAPTFLFDPWHDTGYNGASLNLTTSSFGLSGDIPIAGDWDGSGTKRIGVFRNGLWLLDMNGNGIFDNADKSITFGQAGDLPVLGDWNGTGRIKLGLFRQGTFILDLSGHLSGAVTGFSDATFSFGLPGDLPVANDWNQSGTTKVGVFRAGQWLVDYNGDQVFNGSDKTYTFGQAGDIPVIGDWQGDGIPKIGVYRSGIWLLDYGGVNKVLQQGVLNLVFAFGATAYIPLVL